MRLLLIEDETTLARHLKRELNRAGFAVDLADNGVDGEFLGREEDYDAIILDLGLPKKPGLEVLGDWRKRENKTPVLILTARDAWHERVDGLKAGADDYLGKPFHFEELLARINALLRRRYGQAGDTLSVAGVTLNEEHQEAITPDGKSLELTGTEFRLLRYFMLNPGKILSKTRLTDHVYEGDDDRDSNVIEVYVNRLRQKLGKDLIQTRRGQGYVFGDRR